jgi:predicted PurR-regulated permease PerM
MAKEHAEAGLASVFANRWVKLVILILCVVLFGWLVYTLRGILVPFGLAVVAAYVLNPLVAWLQAKLRWPRTCVVVGLMTLVTLIAIGLLSIGVYYTVTSVQEMVPAARRALAATADGENLWEKIQIAIESIPNEVRVHIEKMIEELPQTIRVHFKEISGSFFRILGATLALLFNFILSSFSFVLLFVVTGYLLIDLPKLTARLRDLLPRRYKESILRVAGAIDRDVHAFFRGQILVALVLSVIYGAGLVLCGIDFALPIAMVAGLANIVPYLGIAVGMAPALLFAFVPYTGLLVPIGVVATFIIGQTIEGLYLTPKIVGDNVGLHPVVVILAILVFGQLLGFLGIIFAVPLAAVVKVLLGEALAYYRAHLQDA